MKINISAIFACCTIISGCEFGLPSCESTEAKTTLIGAFNSAQFARQLHLSAVEITDAKTIPGSSEQLRKCSATVAMNNREQISVKYTLAPRDDGQYMLEFEIRE